MTRLVVGTREGRVAIGWAEIGREREPDWEAALDHVGRLPAEACGSILARVAGPDVAGADEDLRTRFADVVAWCQAGWEGEDSAFQCAALRRSRVLMGSGEALVALILLHETGAGEAAGFWRPEQDQP